MILKTKFTRKDADRAAHEWGANCGPGALAAILGLTLDGVRPHLGDFDRKLYMTPTMIYRALDSAERGWRKTDDEWPGHGLVRVQWDGPWMKPGVPERARYGHTHWIGARALGFSAGDPVMIFDINCMVVGGWVPLQEWSYEVVPWLLGSTWKRATRYTGKWSATHRLEVQP